MADDKPVTNFDKVTTRTDDYLIMTSNEILNKLRTQYDTQYDASIYNAHKYLQSACTHCASILDKMTDIIRAKGELLKNGVDIFARIPEPDPQEIGNTALVVPKLTAEDDFENRYETPMGYTAGGSSGSGAFNGDLGLIGNEVTEQVWNYFTKTWGITEEGAAALMGNIEQESTFDPNAGTLAHDDHFGLCQWGHDGHRVEHLQTFAGDQYNTVSAQLQFIREEMDNNDYYEITKNAVRTHNDPASIAVIVLNNYEGAPGQAEARRKKLAEKWYETYKGK